MIIIQVLNNNVVMADDSVKGEVIAVGSGIGFHAKRGQNIDDSKVQKVFVCGTNKRIIELMDQITPAVLEVTELISVYADEKYEIKIGNEVFFLLVDHINYAVKRLQEGLQLDNPFLLEIKQYFPNEYDIGLYARELIIDMCGVKIPDEEIGYISMHMIASEYHQERRIVSKVFEVMDTSVSYIRNRYLGEFQEDSLAYNRLVTHIKFFAQRYANNKENQKSDRLLDSTINGLFREESECINGLSTILEEKFGRPVTQSEKNYIALHLRNCRSS